MRRKFKTVERWHTGDFIRFKTCDNQLYAGNIKMLGDSSLFISDQTIAYSRICYVYLERNGYLRQIFLKGAGSAFKQLPVYLLLYGNINAVVYGLWSPQYLMGSIAVNSGIFLLGAGLDAIYKHTTYRQYRMNHYRLVYLNFSPP